MIDKKSFKTKGDGERKRDFKQRQKHTGHKQQVGHWRQTIQQHNEHCPVT